MRVRVSDLEACSQRGSVRPAPLLFLPLPQAYGGSYLASPCVSTITCSLSTGPGLQVHSITNWNSCNCILLWREKPDSHTLTHTFQDIAHAGSDKMTIFKWCGTMHTTEQNTELHLDRSRQPSSFFLRCMTSSLQAVISFKVLFCTYPCKQCKEPVVTILQWTMKAFIFFLNLVPFLYNAIIQADLTCFHVHNTG